MSAATTYSDYAKAFQAWLEGICTAYNGVLPSGITPSGTYIRYDSYIDKFGSAFIQPLRIYATNSSNVGDYLKVLDDLDAAIGEGGYLLDAPTVKAFIRKGSPFFQNMMDERENVKEGYVNLIITIYQKER